MKKILALRVDWDDSLEGRRAFLEYCRARMISFDRSVDEARDAEGGWGTGARKALARLSDTRVGTLARYCFGHTQLFVRDRVNSAALSLFGRENVLAPSLDVDSRERGLLQQATETMIVSGGRGFAGLCIGHYLTLVADLINDGGTLFSDYLDYEHRLVTGFRLSRSDADDILDITNALPMEEDFEVLADLARESVLSRYDFRSGWPRCEADYSPRALLGIKLQKVLRSEQMRCLERVYDAIEGRLSGRYWTREEAGRVLLCESLQPHNPADPDAVSMLQQRRVVNVFGSWRRREGVFSFEHRRWAWTASRDGT
jgi:hypothetical protein